MKSAAFLEAVAHSAFGAHTVSGLGKGSTVTTSKVSLPPVIGELAGALHEAFSAWVGDDQASLCCHLTQ